MTDKQTILLALVYLSIYVPLIALVVISRKESQKNLNERVDKALKEAAKSFIMRSQPSLNKNEVVHKFEV